ncbi:MAG: DUF6011 domain-containing protein [Chloroflexota bacterium]
MEGKLRCKKCGRVLKSPASIARGLGSICAGATGGRGKTFRVRMKRSSGMAYPSAGVGERRVPLFSGEMLVKPATKRDLYRRRREERRRSFETRQPFQCGLLMPKRKPLVYEPLEDGSWKENPSGRVIPHERLQQYLTKYRFI